MNNGGILPEGHSWPDPGGESYIPLDPAKRKRSLEIFSEMGKRLGIADDQEKP